MKCRLTIKETQDRIITPSGLILVGSLLSRTKFGDLVNRLGKPKGVKHQNSSCVISYVGMLCQGKTDYEDVRELQADTGFNCRALQINTIPSAEITRQRMDDIAFELGSTDMIMEESLAMVKSVGQKPTALFTGHVPLDVDVSPHDNSNTKKEGVSLTYKGVDGYAPIYAYIGEEGYVCNVELRDGCCHSQCDGTVDFLAKTLRLAKQATEEKLLVRMDSGNDSKDNIELFENADNVDYLIKRNLRSEKAEAWLETAKEHGIAVKPRDGKIVYTGSIYKERASKEPLRIAFQVAVRNSLPNGQILLEPRIDVATWWTSLKNPEADIIRLYRDHATCEQFHSEIKSDLGMERFPSGKFDTNAAIVKLAAMSLNILRIVGMDALKGPGSMSRHEVKRLRAKTVINRFMLIAGRVIVHARQMFLTLGRSNIWSSSFTRLYEAFS